MSPTPPPEPPASTPRKSSRAVTAVTPRNRSVVRVVDAMGREIEEAPIPPPAVEDPSSSVDLSLGAPLSHNEAVGRIRRTISSMREELSDADRYALRARIDKVHFCSDLFFFSLFLCVQVDRGRRF